MNSLNHIANYCNERIKEFEFENPAMASAYQDVLEECYSRADVQGYEIELDELE